MKKLKGFCLTLIIVILSVTMAVGTMAMTAFATPLAGSDVVGATDPVNFYTEFVYGEDYSVADEKANHEDVVAKIKVVAPNGQPVKISADNKITANQIGAYTLKYSNYSYNVKCVLEKDYELRVDYAGAEIPTYIQKGSKVRIPAASLWYKNEDGEFVKDDKYPVKAIVENITDTATDAKVLRTVVIPDVGSYTVHYFANVGGDKGTKYISQDFTIKAQSKFEDKTKPSLTVVNVPNEISLKTKVTLPVATAKDDYDANTKVSVTVEEFDEATKKYVAVKTVKADENGFGEVIDDATPIVFDNKNSMSFYPMKKTTYRIVYTAIDDTLDAEGNEVGKSTPHTYLAKCIDKTAPILKEIKDDQIPTKWGKEAVTRVKLQADADGAETLKGEALKINFPFPEFVDNDNDTKSISFEIRDTINNQTVIKFDNILDETGNGNKYTADSSNGIIPGSFTFEKTGLKLNLADYCNKIAAETPAKTYTGDYTVTYQARDSRPNISTKTYTINLAEEFTDSAAPDAKVMFEDKYLVVNSQESDFVVPQLKPNDESDTRLTISYKLVSGAKEIVVKGGETAKLKMTKNGEDTADKPYLIVKNADKTQQYLDLSAGTLAYDVTVTDDAKNTTTSSNTAKPIRVLKESDFNNWATVLTHNFTNMLDLTTEEKVVGAKMNLGGFTLEAKEGYRDFVGFEMTLTDAKNNILSTDLSFETYFAKTDVNNKNSAGVNHIEKISFVPESAGVYTLYIRIFDITGRSYVKSFSYTVTASDSDSNPDLSSAKIPEAGNIYTTYQLQNVGFNPAKYDKARQYIVRKVTAGGKFSLMGTQFTAYTEGNYNFKDGYYKEAGADLTPCNSALVNGYTLTADTNATPAWQLQGKMPTISKKDATVTLPIVVATANYFNAEITVTIKSPTRPLSIAKATESAAEQLKKDVQIDANGRYFFKTTEEGSYTVAYTAVYGNTSLPPQTYTIKAGDTIAPWFSLLESHDTRAIEGSKFSFKEIVLEGDDKTEDTAKLKEMKFIKRLKAPDGTVVYKVEDYGDAARKATTPKGEAEYVFDKTGTYTVEYQVFDKAGNAIPTYESISVSAAKVNNPFSTKVISVILIIVGVLLIAGVILYFVRFRKNKSSK